jgi:hypothetical protein
MSFFSNTYAPQNNTFVQNNYINAGAPQTDPNQLQAAYTQGCSDMQTQMLERENQDLKCQLAHQQQQGGHNKSMFNMGGGGMNPLSMLGMGG